MGGQQTLIASRECLEQATGGFSPNATLKLIGSTQPVPCSPKRLPGAVSCPCRHKASSICVRNALSRGHPGGRGPQRGCMCRTVTSGRRKRAGQDAACITGCAADAPHVLQTQQQWPDPHLHPTAHMLPGRAACGRQRACLDATPTCLCAATPAMTITWLMCIKACR